MKNLFVMGAIALLTTTLFSCTADEYETAETKKDLKKDSIPNAIQADYPPDGPGDDTVPVKPPK